jgi:hypothetical protein
MNFWESGTGRTGSNSYQDTFNDSYGPRIGFAYQVHPDTVVRAGYGIYYQNLKIGGFGENDSQGFFGSYSYPGSPVRRLRQSSSRKITAYPGPTPPFIDPTGMNGQGPTVIMSKTARPGTTQTWTLDIEQQLPGNFMVVWPTSAIMAITCRPSCTIPTRDFQPTWRAALAWGRTSLRKAPVRPAPANSRCSSLRGIQRFGISGPEAVPAVRKCAVDSVTMSDPFGVYTYHAMQVQAQKRISAGLTARQLHLVEDPHQCRLGVPGAGQLERQRQRRRAEHLQPQGRKGTQPVRRSATPDSELHLSTALRQRQAICQCGRHWERTWWEAGSLPACRPIRAELPSL